MRLTYGRLFCSAFCVPAALFLATTLHAATLTYNGHTYFLTNTAEDWQSAENEAVADGGHLASIHNLADDIVLANFFVPPGSPGAIPPVWIGFFDPNIGDGGFGGPHNTDFIWSDGSPVDFTNWAGGEPNNAGTGEYWTALGWHYSAGISVDNSTWNDTPINGANFGGATAGVYFGLIETTAPEPGAIAMMMGGIAALVLRRRRK